MMETGFDLKTAFTDVLNTLVSSVADVVPRAITAVIVILVGLLVAKIAERAIRTVFDRFKINDFLDRVGVNDNLRRIGLSDAPGKILSRTIYFLLIILFTQAVTAAVGLTTISSAIGSFFSYLPNLAAAFLVLLLGMMVAQFLAKAVSQSASDAGVEYADLLGRIVSGLVGFVVIIMTISQLKIDTEIIRSVVLVLLSGVAIAIALSFGLGTRDVTRNLVAGLYARKLFQVGEEIDLAGERGTLTAITPVQTLIMRDGQTISVPNRIFLDEVVKQ